MLAVTDYWHTCQQKVLPYLKTVLCVVVNGFRWCSGNCRTQPTFWPNGSDENCIPGKTTTTGVSCKTCPGNKEVQSSLNVQTVGSKKNLNPVNPSVKLDIYCLHPRLEFQFIRMKKAAESQQCVLVIDKVTIFYGVEKVTTRLVLLETL